VSYEQVLGGCDPAVLAVADLVVIGYMYATTELSSR
jgi:hypothetical protein